MREFSRDQLDKELGELKPAEKALLDLYEMAGKRLDENVFLELGDGKLPDETLSEGESQTRTIRALLLRALILGEIEGITLPADGLAIGGAYIEGDLDLNFAKIPRAVALLNCRFSSNINLRQAHLPVLNLNGSSLGKLTADGVEIGGSVFLQDIEAASEIRFVGAKITGNLECQGAKFNGKQKSLIADGVEIGGAVFLENIEAAGEICFTGAKITANLECQGAKFNGKQKSLIADGVEIGGAVFLQDIEAAGEIRFLGAKITGQLACHGAKFNGTGFSLNLQAATIGGEFFFLPKEIAGALNLSEADLGVIIDQKSSWPEKGKLRLRGARYRGFQGAAPISARERLDWLDRMMPEPDKLEEKRKIAFASDADPENKDVKEARNFLAQYEFSPQPYRQLARVLRNAGHIGDARQVLYEMEHLIAKEARREREDRLRHLAGEITLYSGDEPMPREYSIMRGGKPKQRSAKKLKRDHILFNAFFWMSDNFIGYGYKLDRAFFWLAGMIFFMWALGDLAYDLNQMVPNSDVIITSREYERIDSPRSWSSETMAGQDWESFAALIYAADIVLPLIDFGQEEAWGPARDRGWLGYWVWLLRWPLKLLGWVIISLVIASITGFMQHREQE